MDALKAVTDIIAGLPINSIERARAELLKQQVEMMEDRLKMMEDRVKWSEEKLTRTEAENQELKAEVVDLRERVAASSLGEEFELRGPFCYLKGTDVPRCPDCKKTLSKKGRLYECRECKWHYEEPITLSHGSIDSWARNARGVRR
jgi:hypothetical protein